MPAGYSGRPLSQKLGFTPTTCAVVLNPPADYMSLLSDLPEGVAFESAVTKKTTLVHLFVTERADLNKQLTKLRNKLPDDASLWVSWPKKASKVKSTVTEDTIRELALPIGFVDIKVCAVSDIWSGLKLVVRKELRAKPKP